MTARLGSNRMEPGTARLQAGPKQPMAPSWPMVGGGMWGIRGLAGCGPLAWATRSPLSEWFRSVLRQLWRSWDRTFWCQCCPVAGNPQLSQASWGTLNSPSGLKHVPSANVSSGSFCILVKIHANISWFPSYTRTPAQHLLCFLGLARFTAKCWADGANF